MGDETKKGRKRWIEVVVRDTGRVMREAIQIFQGKGRHGR